MRLCTRIALLLLVLSLVACGAPRRRGGGGGGGGRGSPAEGEGERPAEGEGEGAAEGEGEGAAEGEGEGAAEGEGEGPAEGEGEGPAEGEGEGPAEGEGEGPAEGEGEGPPCDPRPETCNGADDDCDGRVDEDDPELGSGCSTGMPGPCWQGRLRCQEGILVCVGVVQPADEVCDGLDNDCNGEADEGDPGAGEECESEEPGECGYGISDCRDGVLRCDPVDPEPEVCDGLDNDCDRQVDEETPGVGEACDTGQPGVCAAGLHDCLDGAPVCVRQVAPGPEECDGLDNDCNGEVDEGSPGDGEECDTGEDGVCAPGIGTCLAGVFSCARLEEPSPELCDLLDNDCDGEVDDGLHGAPCDAGGVGVCGVGVGVCVDGESDCVDPGVASPEVCDLLDNDCDGEVDEDDGQGECAVDITNDNDAYGHHGACNGWNGCGSAETCALWACQFRGFPALAGFGRTAPCNGGQFRTCHLFNRQGQLDENWGTSCAVMGVSDIRCR